MEKNVAIACGLGDLFTFITRLDSFFEANPEYTSIKFWTWLHNPKLAKELVSLCDHEVSVFSIDEMNEFILKGLSKNRIDKVTNLLIKQNYTGVGVDKYIKYINTFFPNMEQWIYLPVYDKYSSSYPYKLNKVSPKKTERPYFVVHPFSTTVKTEKPERTWSTKRWGTLIRMIKEYYREYDIVIIGTKKDIIEGPRDFPIHPDVIDLRGKTTLTEAIEYVYGSGGFVGINSWSSFIALWAGISTYSQWFVQEQLIPTHHPEGDLRHLFIQRALNGAHPTVEEAWDNVRTLLDARITIQ